MPDRADNHFVDITRDTEFHFDCHPGVSCFTECCRRLDLALTPYDVLRLKNGLGMGSAEFLERYVIIEWDQRLLFPQCSLTMVDDGRESCIFVSENGCTVYEDRPGACRAYPVGRGASRQPDGAVREMLVMVREPHCLGFAQSTSQTPKRYFADQGMSGYSRANDRILSIVQHPRILAGYRPTRQQLDQYILALYNLDEFRRAFCEDSLSMNRPLQPDELQGLAGDDELLLELGIRWLRQELFGP